MTAEQKELYFYTIEHFENEISRIHSGCVAPLMAVKQIVKKSMQQYLKEYCSYTASLQDNTVFSDNDFKVVSEKIYNEIMNK